MRLDLRQRGRVLFRISAPYANSATGLGDSICHSEPDTAIAAGDQCDLPGQVKGLVRHDSLLLHSKKYLNQVAR